MSVVGVMMYKIRYGIMWMSVVGVDLIMGMVVVGGNG